MGFLLSGEAVSSRCDELQSLLTRGCNHSDIENPRGGQHILEDKPVTNRVSGSSPGAGKLKLENITQIQPQKLSLTLRAGFGSFVEKTVMPFISTTPAKLLNPCTGGLNCTSPFSYKNVLKLTSDGNEFNTLVGKQQISGNLDSPEGGFDAIMQVAVCGLGGIVLPNDGKCHLENNTYTMSHYYDYPSIAHLVQKLSDNNIQTIFAVTGDFQPVYKELQNLIPKSAVGTLSSNSSNVINLIIDAYNSLSSEVILENSKLPEGLSIAYTSRCKNGLVSEGEKGRKCSNISIGDEVTFTIDVTSTGCPKQGKPEVIKIKPLGFNEEVEITLNFICDCGCSKDGVANSDDCDFGSGTFECNPGRVGRKCECSSTEVSTEDMDRSCAGTTAPISAATTAIVCVAPASNGRCDCRVCTCDPMWSGSACDCSLDTSTCLAANNLICNDWGTCEDCVQCRTFGTGDKAKHCEKECSDFTLVMVKERDQLPPASEGPFPVKFCKDRDANDCWFYFTYAVNNNTTEIYVMEKLECPTGPDIIPIVLGVVIGIVMIGLALLLIWKLLMIIHDRREFAKFEKEKMNAKWDTGENPIYKSAVTTVVNPKYEGK
ncbi:hypothetical protein CRUP_017351 [Coryphaenoides rupestris]|nr:hypothetical protein CRUP_017351 [Coryphaenoides rupestris]